VINPVLGVYVNMGPCRAGNNAHINNNLVACPLHYIASNVSR